MNIVNKTCALTIAILSFFASVSVANQKSDLSQYDVVWNSMSHNSSESMPCGGGDIGTNVWVENGDIMLYLSKSGAFDENGIFPKFGRIRIHFKQSPFKGGLFQQKLHLNKGFITINGKNAFTEVALKVWVDVFHPVIHVDIQSTKPVAAEAIYETWRFEDYEWTSDLEFNASRAFIQAPVKPIVRKDSVRFQDNQVLFYHRNRDLTLFDMTVQQEGLYCIKSQLWNPLKGLTFGGCMYAANMHPDGMTSGIYGITRYRGWKLSSTNEARHFNLNIVLHCDQTSSIAQFLSELKRLLPKTATDRSDAEKSQKWWENYFKRSYICINADKPDSTSNAWQIGRNYNVFRYQMGCNAYGNCPTKFNGGLFTFDPCYVDAKYKATPDHRDWGGTTFTAQNQRLLYWPLLKSGDYDMMASQLDFYLHALKNAELRTKLYWGHDGACFTEQMEMFGLPVVYEYGWKRPSSYPVGVEYNQWLEYLWDTSLEFCLMALDKQQYNGDDITKYIPLIENCLEFFNQHYQQESLKRTLKPYNGYGKLVIFPGSATESYKVTYNSSSTAAALHTTLQRLLELPGSYMTPEQRIHWSDMLKRIPSVPTMQKESHIIIAPAQAWDRMSNHEMPQLYPVFPWGIYGIEKPDLNIAVDTWKYAADTILQKECPDLSWHQDAIFCARLGLTDEAKERITRKLKNSVRRFPTFWGPGHDWAPDHNWGGSGMIGLQEMLLQTDHKKILLFPAWPKEWNVKFKLHAPYQTVIEGCLKDGKLIELNVYPRERAMDIKNMLKQ